MTGAESVFLQRVPPWVSEDGVGGESLNRSTATDAFPIHPWHTMGRIVLRGGLRHHKVAGLVAWSGPADRHPRVGGKDLRCAGAPLEIRKATKTIR